MSTKIAICVTEHNRPEIFKKCLENINKYKSENSYVFIVDDASEPPTHNSTHRFDYNVGISVAKNKCFELSKDYDYVFLFDSDCYPIKSGFENIYINSGLEHAMYIFQDFSTSTKLNDTSILRTADKYIEYTHPRGCMLFFTRKAIDTAGGMRPQFRKWGFEHGELSDRIYSLGLTPSPYCDVIGSSEYIYSLDEHQEVITTVGGNERQKVILNNRILYDKLKGSTDFVTYSPSNGINFILSCYFTGVTDTQRGVNMPIDVNSVYSLANSVKEHEFILFNDCFDFGERVKCEMNPYFQRWFTYREWLLKNKNVNYLWMVDATDVELLRYPFDLLPDVLYVGYEYGNTLNNRWMINHTVRGSEMQNLFRNSSDVLLNCGVIGGHRDIVLEFLNKMCLTIIHNFSLPFDMQHFNYVMYTSMRTKFITGNDIVTKFKHNEYNSISIWKHK